MRKTAPAITQAMDSFALKATFISGMLQNGKYSEEEAYEMMKKNWKKLKHKKKAKGKQ